MTPNERMKFKNQAQCRSMVLASVPAGQKRFDTDYYVEGFAARYEPYVLYYDENDEPVYERFDRGCFDNCDMRDIIMQYDHAGKVFARTGDTNTLIVEPQEAGLFVAADLGRTAGARDMYGDIDARLVTRMSWRFRLGEWYYDKDTRTIIHKTVKKIYDVSAVSIPANDNTEINARAWVDGVIEQAARSEAELEEQRTKIRTKINIALGGISK